MILLRSISKEHRCVKLRMIFTKLLSICSVLIIVAYSRNYLSLCDNCNWEFKGFAVPGTVSTKPTKKPKKEDSSELVS